LAVGNNIRQTGGWEHWQVGTTSGKLEGGNIGRWVITSSILEGGNIGRWVTTSSKLEGGNIAGGYQHQTNLRVGTLQVSNNIRQT